MSEEEIRKALEIIKQPITINCIEYKYFDQENYDKLISVYDNCLWIVNLFEQAKEHIEPIQQKNKQLKEVIEEANNHLTILMEIILSQPTDNGADDLWLLSKLENISKILDKAEGGLNG